MALIKIQRPNKFTNKVRNYQILIDGKKVGMISNGEIKEFEVMGGHHTVKAKIDMFSSPDLSININDSETKSLEVDVAKNAFILIALFGLFYLLFGWKKYLTLTEIK